MRESSIPKKVMPQVSLAPPATALPVSSAVRALSISTGSLVALLAAAAFALSFDALRDLAHENGVAPGLTWLWPLVLDGAIVVFSLSALRASLHREPVGYAMALVVVATVASVLFNVAHAPSGLLAHTMAAVPPVFLFLSFELLMRQLRSEVERSSKLASLNEVSSLLAKQEEEVSKLVGQIEKLSNQRESLKSEVKACKSASVQDLLDKANLAKADKIEARRARVAELARQNLAPARIAEALNVSAKTVKRDLAALGAAA